MNLDPDQLERVAKAAQEFARVQLTRWSPDEIGRIDDEPLAEFIAACSPDVVLALVARAREMHGWRNLANEYERELEKAVGRCDGCGCLNYGICDCPGIGR